MATKSDTPLEAKIRENAKESLFFAGFAFFAATSFLSVVMVTTDASLWLIRIIIGAIAGMLYASGIALAVLAAVKFSRIPLPEEMEES